MFVFGKSTESFLVGVVLPNRKDVMAWAKEKSKTGNYEELLQDPALKELVLEVC